MAEMEVKKLCFDKIMVKYRVCVLLKSLEKFSQFRGTLHHTTEEQALELSATDEHKRISTIPLPPIEFTKNDLPAI